MQMEFPRAGDPHRHSPLQTWSSQLPPPTAWPPTAPRARTVCPVNNSSKSGRAESLMLGALLRGRAGGRRLGSLRLDCNPAADPWPSPGTPSCARVLGGHRQDGRAPLTFSRSLASPECRHKSSILVLSGTSAQTPSAKAGRVRQTASRRLQMALSRGKSKGRQGPGGGCCWEREPQERF